MKWDKYQGRDVIPLWVADMDFLSPPAVIDALSERVKHGIFGYTLAMTGIVPRVNTLGYTAAAAAYRESHEWRRALLEYLRGNRDLVLDSVNRMPGLCPRSLLAKALERMATAVEPKQRALTTPKVPPISMAGGLAAE